MKSPAISSTVADALIGKCVEALKAIKVGTYDDGLVLVGGQSRGVCSACMGDLVQ